MKTRFGQSLAKATLEGDAVRMEVELERLAALREAGGPGVDAEWETSRSRRRLRNPGGFRREWNRYTSYVSKYGGGWFD